MTTLATLRTVHEDWSWVVIVGNGVAGMWSLAAMRWAPLRARVLWWFTAFVQLSVFVQAGLGAGLVGDERGGQARQFHMFYGFLGIVAVAIIYSYRQQMRDRLYLLYGLGGLFIMGLGIRAAQVRPL